MRHSTTSYPIQAPEPLWDAFTAGPAETHAKHNDRLLAVIALDTLHHYSSEELDAEPRQLAVEIVEDTPGMRVPDTHRPDDPPPDTHTGDGERSATGSGKARQQGHDGQREHGRDDLTSQSEPEVFGDGA